MVAVIRHKVIALLVVFLGSMGLALAEEPFWDSGVLETVAVPEGQGSVSQGLQTHFQDYPSSTASFTPASPSGGLFWKTSDSYWRWTADYRVRSFFESHTSYQFGMPEWYSPTWAPLSKLDWSLDSTWHGFEIGLESETERIHFEWMMPMRPNIHGSMADYDWMTPSDPSQLDSLTLSSLRWNEGQMIDFGGEMKMTNYFFRWPIEIWPMLGFRWQRFNMTGYDVDSLIPPDGMVYRGPVITFSQQYYTFYLGGQFRSNTVWAGVPITLKFQGDWGATAGYNSDHHLLRDAGTRFTMESTTGSTVHLAFAAEAMLHRHLSVGMQLDHMAIRTTGTHRWVVYSDDIDVTWSHGVEVKSDQTSLTGFVRLRF